MPINNLFPQPVGFYKLGRNLTEEESSYVKNLETRPNVGNTTSKNTTVLKSKELGNIKKFIETSLADYFKTVYDPKHEAHLRITQSWCNHTEPNEYHHKHAHPNSFISGVFYPQADAQVDKIYFYREQYNPLKFVPNTWNTWNSDSWWFEVGTGDLILFPSSLTHMVEVETSVLKQTRISLSFNTFPVGVVGEEATLTHLQLE
jgi:uncharacterized protein (TIGR02466 family)